MSRKTHTSANKHAEVFAALGDETRLTIVQTLSNGQPVSISLLTKGTNLTRQAVTKHLSVLEHAGVVSSVRSGRENLFVLNPRPIKDLQEYLDVVAGQWDDALSRLKVFVEETD